MYQGVLRDDARRLVQLCADTIVIIVID